MEVRLGDQLEFRSGRSAPERNTHGPFAVYGSNGVIGYTTQHNTAGPVIVIGRVGTYCGTVRYCPSDAWVTDNALACRAKNPQESRFWYYALQTYQLNQHRTGSGQPLLNQGILRDLSVPSVAAPDRPRIGALLGALDDKIAANERVIRTAEALMVAVVEPVEERTSLSGLAERSTLFLEPPDFAEDVAHFSLPAFDDGAQPLLVTGASVKSGKYLLRQPCVLVAKLNPRFPRVWNVPSLPPEMALASSEFVVLQPAGVDTSVLWAALRQPDVSDMLAQRVVGTSGSHQRVRTRDVLDVGVRDVRRLTSGQARAIADLGALCQARRMESARLTAYRDAVLPLLISGEVTVADAG
ncbi:restriction endonuclease subunit S [Mycobacterium asiaticum]|uniref:restriction endonuclease subunit S n=1 Tax=Mycobacterium asiaticum TaxID=1790 RepID=UPI00055C8832|nr:restriction endonuclease subunit S [Mycobacterium asiaticum]ORA15863.1 restriction endonuclease subunit S [Mycobacterium asiaticum DSM 44297]